LRTTLLVLALALACASNCLPAAASTSLEAYVYVSTLYGTYAYDASSAGKLTAVVGSPFQVGTQVGTNGKFFVGYAADDATLTSYAVAASGAIETSKPVSSINTQLYSGAECGATITSARFSHSGAQIYVELDGAEGVGVEGACDAFQTFAISSAGKLTFVGDTEVPQDGDGSWGLMPTFTGNSDFGYGFQFSGYDDDCGPTLNLFQTGSQKMINYLSTYVYPAPTLPPGAAGWVLAPVFTDNPTDLVAMAMYTTNDLDCEDNDIEFGPFQLASFTVNSAGELTTTNTAATMPALGEGAFPTSMTLNYAGTVLAVATGREVEFFHFNGAKPITKFTRVTAGGSDSGSITQVAFDSQNHLYVLNASGEMFVYAVTTKSVKIIDSVPGVAVGNFVVRSK
jgi:hypothetical protein